MYQDMWGRWHHKPCRDGIPSSNNAWIYTAYAKLLGLTVFTPVLFECFLLCVYSEKPLKIDRHPMTELPPISRDEILGLVCLGYIDHKWLERYYWQFCNIREFEPRPLWEIAWWKAIKAAWKLRKSHRNALWEEPDLWHLGFRLPPQDTYYVLRKHKVKPSWFHTLYFYVSAIRTLRRGGHSGLLILWMKLKDLGMADSWLFKRIDLKSALIGEMGAEHPFIERIS